MFSSNATQVSSANYIEDVFSTYLYKGNSSTQTITNGIDLSGKGGLTWIKVRDFTYNHYLYDTARGVSDALFSNSTSAQSSSSNFSSFDSSGFTLNSSGGLNNSSYTYASWTFRKQPKFFDVVTYTGNGDTSKTINHNLGSVPGMIIVKNTSASTDWVVYHRSIGNTKYLKLNTTAAEATLSMWNDTTPTSTQFTVGGWGEVNNSGETYVAYLFAHDAGGFGDSGSESVIKCGSFTHTNGTATDVSLGWEAQWILMKRSDSTNNWVLMDNMRGMPVGGSTSYLYANTSGAEASTTLVNPSANGFSTNASLNSGTYIYIAIRRGPMKVPTSGTSVFAPYVTNTVAASSSGSTSASALYRSDFVTDFVIQTRKASVTDKYALSRLTGNKYLITNSTDAEWTSTVPWDSNIAALNFSTDYGQWMFKRAPSFFDVVCFTAGTSTNRRITHNLTVAPELILLKCRNVTQSWYAYSQQTGISGILYPNQNWAVGTVSNAWGNSSPTSTDFGINEPTFASSGDTYVAYLFATCSGVSKVGSYTGTGTTKQVDCGFTGGARFVLIKRTDSTGDWYVWDTARGIVSGNDPYLLLNSTAAETTGTDYIDTYSAGFEISSTAPAAINASGGTFIFLAIA